MYKIIGANRTEYGPASAEQVRQWIAEGRVNAETLAQAVGETAWKPISSYPEFASSFPGKSGAPPLISPPPPTPPPLGAPISGEAGRAHALSEVSGPAIGLMVVAALGIAHAIFQIVAHLAGFTFDGYRQFHNHYFHGQDEEFLRTFQASGGALQTFFSVIQLATGAFVIYGALKMQKLQNHGLCIVTAIVALLPCFSPCCCIGIFIGIWALIVLNQANVRAYFS